MIREAIRLSNSTVFSQKDAATPADEVAMLPEEVIAGAAQYAQLVKDSRHMIPNDAVVGQIYNELGWN